MYFIRFKMWCTYIIFLEIKCKKIIFVITIWGGGVFDVLLLKSTNVASRQVNLQLRMSHDSSQNNINETSPFFHNCKNQTILIICKIYIDIIHFYHTLEKTIEHQCHSNMPPTNFAPLVKDLPKSFFSPKESIWNLCNIISIQKHHLGIFMLRSSTQNVFKGPKKFCWTLGHRIETIWCVFYKNITNNVNSINFNWNFHVNWKKWSL